MLDKFSFHLYKTIKEQIKYFLKSSRPKSKRLQELKRSKQRVSTTFLLKASVSLDHLSCENELWFYWLLRTRGKEVKARDCQSFHRHFFKNWWNWSEPALPIIPTLDCREWGLDVQQESGGKKRGQLSLRGCHHGLAFLQMHCLNLHCWWGSKAVHLKLYCLGLP